ncbi:hypothetical protein B0H16DRAFT_1529179 [Mycena metata]|uniref:Uncharacterized protein n=1 Tax=Mycena metata TaxID=1033252 RepID=A0AAD7JH84_9AGAR|nr:hypothetical protein B0H16DRAFT_1529179 [Mycena metata]
MLPSIDPYTQHYAISRQSTATFIDDLTRRITALHFLFIDCNATYRDWESWEPIQVWVGNYPVSLVELHVSFAYTSPPPALLRDAPRGTFFPPRDHADTADFHSFDGVKKLVVWDANADFVAFMTTACPRLERVESTAEFSAEDVPEKVAANIKARLVFSVARRDCTRYNPDPGGEEGGPISTPSCSYKVPSIITSEMTAPVPLKRGNAVWRLAKRVFRRRT